MVMLEKRLSLHLIGKFSRTLLVSLDQVGIFIFDPLYLPPRHFEGCYRIRNLHSISNHILSDQLADLRLDDRVWFAILMRKLVIFASSFFIYF